MAVRAIALVQLKNDVRIRLIATLPGASEELSIKNYRLFCDAIRPVESRDLGSRKNFRTNLGLEVITWAFLAFD